MEFRDREDANYNTVSIPETLHRLHKFSSNLDFFSLYFVIPIEDDYSFGIFRRASTLYCYIVIELDSLSTRQAYHHLFSLLSLV